MERLTEMAEAHLLYVQREIQTLMSKREEASQEIERLTKYLNEGVEVVNQAKSGANAALATDQDTPDE